MNNKLELINNLNTTEKQVVLSILKELSQKGKSELLDKIKYREYKEIPVDIETFLKDPLYLGKGLIDSNGKFTVFPYWVKVLKDIFPDNTTTKYRTLVLTGGIGLGKSFVAVLCMLYLLHRMMCLKDPYTFYGLQPIDKITFSLINITIEAAKGVAWDKLQSLLQTSPWFMARGTISGQSELVWNPPKGLEIVVGSSNNAIIGRAVFCLDGETIIKTNIGDYKLKDLVNKQIKVFSYNNDNIIESEYCTVKPTIKTKEFYEIELENGSVIKCTGNHKLMLKNGTYKEAQYLDEDDELLSINITTMKIKKITKKISNSDIQFYDVINANPFNNFLVKTNNSYIVSHNCNFTDEVNFSAMTTDTEKIKKKQKTLITQVDARMQSRFMKGTTIPTLQVIASSKNSEQSFLESYIEMKKQNESTTTLVVDEPQWVIRDDKNSDKHFFVAVGNKFLASEILPKDASEEIINSYRAKGFNMLEVPIGYYEQFKDDVDVALTDIAGISTIGALKFISGVRWNEIKTKEYSNPLPDIIEVGTNDKTQYKDFFDISKLDKTLITKPMYIHLDMSKSGDKTGIAGVWIEKKINSEENNAKDLYFKLAFSTSIKAPKGYEISFDKNRYFIKWLKNELGLNIKGVSFDTYQSAQLSQQLARDGFDTKVISVDRLENVPGVKHKICLPYQFLRTCIYEKKLIVYDKCNLLTEEVVGLEKESDGHINHPENGRFGSKDQIDAVCGAVFNASQNVEEFVFDYGEDLDLTLDINNDLDINEEIINMVKGLGLTDNTTSIIDSDDILFW